MTNHPWKLQVSQHRLVHVTAFLTHNTRFRGTQCSQPNRNGALLSAKSYQQTSSVCVCVCVWSHSKTEASRNTGGWQHLWRIRFVPLPCCTCGQSGSQLRRLHFYPSAPELNSQCSLQNPWFKNQDLISFMQTLTANTTPYQKNNSKAKGKSPQKSSTRMATVGPHICCVIQEFNPECMYALLSWDLYDKWADRKWQLIVVR